MMRTYSSDMQMRVAFSAATAFKPNLLIVDEAPWSANTWHTHPIQYDVRSGEILVFRLPFFCPLGPGSYSASALSSSDAHLADNYEWVDNPLVLDKINVDRDYFVGSN